MAHFYIYGDESGKLEQSDYVSFCGYLAHISEWSRVCMEWDNIRIAWGVPTIHMRLIMAPDRDKTGEWPKKKDEWGDTWEKRRDEMLAQLAAVIRDSNIVCIGCVVDSAYFRNMPESKFKRDLENPIFLGFHTLLMHALDKVDYYSDSLPVSLIIDDDHQYAIRCYGLLESMKSRFPRVRKRITAITLGDDKQYPGLQMADMIAYEARNFMVSRLKNNKSDPTKQYYSLTRKLLHQPVLWTAERLDKEAKAYNEKDQ